ncbi:BTB/POZ domain-containing protein-like protein [Leptotrombidium deliense]|uniref:BTB/POZ domain-containing protein-like protein n=1 Tax=Leptotrombidium deliense TaxID=299467 RepID=A0A443RZW1_9ACAR|nr:BTB/POZ domain-containing protein-like protein [Leptotrombidium deliense]
MFGNDTSYVGEDRIKRIRMDNDFKDLTFVVKSNEFKVNKTLMAASCDYFKTMLYGNTNESRMSTIELKSTPKVAFEKVVEFIHNDKCDVDSIEEKNLIDLIGLSHEYQFSHLLQYLYNELDCEDKEFSVDFYIRLFDLSIEKQ